MPQMRTDAIASRRVGKTIVPNHSTEIKTTVNILGFPITALSTRDVVDIIWDKFREKNNCFYVACANPHSIIVALDDLEFSSSLKMADVLLPDGVGVVLGGRLLGKNFIERVTGMDFFKGFSERCNKEKQISYFFLGSSPEVLDRICDRMAREYPAIRVAGVLSPPFKDVFDENDDAVIIEAINKAAPDVLWVGMTAPKQEKWIARNKDRLNVHLVGAIGAVFDFYAGTKKRSPEWLCRIGLEWLPRFLREPRRLWRRNLISSPKFIIHVLASGIKDK